MDGVCDEVVLQPRDGELTVEERFFDGLLEAVCSSGVSVFSPVSDQTLVEQGFGGAEGRLAQASKINTLEDAPCTLCASHV